MRMAAQRYRASRASRAGRGASADRASSRPRARGSPRLDLGQRPADDLELLAARPARALPLRARPRRTRYTSSLTKPGERPERRQLAPAAAVEARLLAQLALRRRERRPRPRRSSPAGSSSSSAPIAARRWRTKHDALLGVQRPRSRPRPACRRSRSRPRRARRSASPPRLFIAQVLPRSARSSRPNHGGEPAAAFSAARSGREVAGMTRSTRGSESAHLSSACGQVSTPNGSSGASSAADGGRAASAPPPSGRITTTATPSSAASGSSTCSHVALERVERHLQRLEAPRAERPLELAERRGRVVRDADPSDPARLALRLEPRQVLLPRDEVVDLLDLDPAEPAELVGVLAACLLRRRAPDLRQHDRLVAASLERRAERALGGSVHRRRVEAAAARVERRADDLARKRLVALERVPGAEPDDRARAAAPPSAGEPARDDAGRVGGAKKPGSSSAPRPMCSSGSPRTPPPSLRRVASSGQAGTTSARQSSSTDRAWCETPRWRSRGSASEMRTASTGRPPSALATLAASASASAPWPSARAGADDARARRRRRPRRNPAPSPTRARRPTVDALRRRRRGTARPRARPRRARAPSAARTVSESETGRAPPATCTYATRSPASAAHTGATWLCSVQQHDGQPAERVRERLRPPPRGSDASWPGVYGSAITCAPSSGGKPEAAREVRVEDVEAAGAELEQPRLLVHEHLVPHLDLARQPRVGDAGDAVDLEPDEARQLLDDRRDEPRLRLSSERHRPAPASRRPSRRDRRRRCARRRCGSRPSRSRD